MKYKDDSQKRKNFIYAMFDNCDILSHYNVNLEKFSAYCDEAEKLYDKNKNPYHNYEHGITGMSSVLINSTSDKLLFLERDHMSPIL